MLLGVDHKLWNLLSNSSSFLRLIICILLTKKDTEIRVEIDNLFNVLLFF
jgi:hypothetical protein